jgi:cellulose synthase/poly-beta-1,6-N-acetylglucosamine synthase-like glycosyltransferase
MMPVFVFWLCAALISWVYVGYPLLLVFMSRLVPRPSRRDTVTPSLSVIVPCHNEEALIEGKIRNLRELDYPHGSVEIIVVSDGSTDETVDVARAAGAETVLDLPRVGKITALNHAVREAQGDVLVFTDADSMLLPHTLRELVSNFADDDVGCVAANEISFVPTKDGPVVRGEGMYWRYEQWIKRLESRVASTVSASGRLYALRRNLFHESQETAGTDDFVISTMAIKAGRRLIFNERARVMVETHEDARAELRRKVRLMNRGMQAATRLCVDLWKLGARFYPMQLLSHKIMRRFVGFLLIALLASTVWLTLESSVWWLALTPQLLFYLLAVAGALFGRTALGKWKIVAVPYFFCLANSAAVMAVFLWLRGVRFETWEPNRLATKSRLDN